ncbi:glycosyltransferase [Brumimicrobium glaciale]|uniref:Glycosyltransferase n=1 Tax=Brumimicrobium glaciale TaxID=200475 RepID=A0A4Q4KKL7_9FLAO|nr:glycosyltransferase [Brumimicrobium glaciale]RYM33913.1 glycosyltransferase [Brumimicrobium glaciale]
MKKINILFLITDLAKGGAERFLVDLCNDLINNPEFEICIGSLFPANLFPELDQRIRVEQLNYQSFSFKGKNECPKYKKLLADFQPDIIHSNRFLGEFLSSYYVDPSIKYVCHGHDNMVQLKRLDAQTFASKEKTLNYFERQWLYFKKYKKVPTHFIANSTHTFDYYTNILPRRQRGNVKLIQYGFDYNKYKIEKPKSISSHGKIRMINVGSYQKKKNQRFFIDVAEELISRGIDFEINLIGDGGLRKSVEEEISSKKLEGFIKVRGIQHNVEKWYAESDIYVHAATYEPFGLVFLEAMSAGLPTITLDGKGNRDIIENDKNGYLLDESNAVQFADKIIEYAQDKEKYTAMSKFAQEYAKQFDVSIKNEELINFYKSIL